MRDDDPTLKSLLDDLLNQEAEHHAPLTPDELKAWRDDALDEETRMALQRRLYLDREGVAALLAEGDAHTPPKISREDAEASWSRFTNRFAGRLTGAKPSVSTQAMRRFDMVLGGLAAAALVVAAILFSLRIRQLTHQRDQLLQPTLATQVELVHLGDVSTRSAESLPALRNRSMVLRLMLSKKWPDYPTYLVHIRTQAGQAIKTLTGEPGDQMLNLTLQRDFFPAAGVYFIEIAGVEAGQPTVLETLQLKVE